jgi:hypothetical protein
VRWQPGFSTSNGATGSGASPAGERPGRELVVEARGEILQRPADRPGLAALTRLEHTVVEHGRLHQMPAVAVVQGVPDEFGLAGRDASDNRRQQRLSQ